MSAPRVWLVEDPRWCTREGRGLADPRDILVLACQATPESRAWLGRALGVRTALAYNDLIGHGEVAALRESAFALYRQWALDPVHALWFEGLSLVDVYRELSDYLFDALFWKALLAALPKRPIVAAVSADAAGVLRALAGAAGRDLSIKATEPTSVQVRRWQRLWPYLRRPRASAELLGDKLRAQALLAGLALPLPSLPGHPRKRQHAPLVALASSHNFAAALAPVLTALRAQGHEPAALGDGAAALRALRRLGMPHGSFMDFLSGADLRAVAAWRGNLRAWRAHLDAAGDTWLLAGDGAPLWPVLRAADSVRILLGKMMELAALQARVLDRAATTQGWQVLLVANDVGGPERLACHVARRHGAATINFQHAALNIQHFVGGIADRMVVWGDASVAVALDAGMARERLFVAGAPKLDALRTTADPIVAGAVRERYGWPASTRVVLWATGRFAGRTNRIAQWLVIRETLQALSALLRRRDDVALAIKLHPLDDVRPYQELLISFGMSGERRVRVLQAEELAPLLHAADVVLVSQSTVALEAAALGRPLVEMAWFNRDLNRLETIEHGVALGATAPGCLPTHVERLLDDRDLRARMAAASPAFVRAYAGEQDGRAAERAAAIVIETARRGAALAADPDPRGDG